MKKQNPISDGLRVLESLGFTRKGKVWTRVQEETIQIIDLQKSQYSNKYYLNIGVCLRKDIEMNQCRWEKSHLAGRFERILDDCGVYNNVMDLENQSLSDDQRISVLKQMILTMLIPWLEKVSTLDGIRSRKDAGELNGFGIRKELHDALVLS